MDGRFRCTTGNDFNVLFPSVPGEREVSDGFLLFEARIRAEKTSRH